VTDAARPYLTVSVPRGYELSTGPTGTARCYQRIRPDLRGEMTAGFELAPLAQADDHQRFLLASDIQTEDAPDVSLFRRDAQPDLAATIAELRSEPLFGVADGDITWDHLELYDDYERAVTDLGIPFVQVVGNHDLNLKATSDADSTRTFESRFGVRYYSFTRGEVHYVVLDDVFYYAGGYLGYLTEEPLTWLANDLALVERGAPVVVFLHIPRWCTLSERMGQNQASIANVVTNREALYRLLESFEAQVLSGHTPGGPATSATTGRPTATGSTR
jgi:Calcineurin-like phosphoesterase